MKYGQLYRIEGSIGIPKTRIPLGEGYFVGRRADSREPCSVFLCRVKGNPDPVVLSVPAITEKGEHYVYSRRSSIGRTTLQETRYTPPQRKLERGFALSLIERFESAQIELKSPVSPASPT